jgi:hypothetical protein
MVSGDDASKGAARSYQEGFQLRRELVEEVVSSVSENYEATSNDEAAETTYNAAFEGGTVVESVHSWKRELVVQSDWRTRFQRAILEIEEDNAITYL